MKALKGRDLDVSKCYYHKFEFRKDTFEKILKEGIKCKFLQGYLDRQLTYNGSFYISLTKGLANNETLNYIQNGPNIMIDNSLRTLKTSVNNPRIFNNTPVPLRYSVYPYEYQRFMYVSPKYFLGIGIALDMDNMIKLNNQYETLRIIQGWLDDLQKDMVFVNITDGKIIDKKLIKKR